MAAIQQADPALGSVVERRLMLELPGFLGLGAIVASTDLGATLPNRWLRSACEGLFQRGQPRRARLG